VITQEYIDRDGIKVFHDDIDDNHSDYNASGLDNLYKVEEKHFWFISRKEFISQQMKDMIDTKSKMIEIGAGTGNVSRYLKRKGYVNIAVGEMHSNGLKYAKSYGIDKCYQFDLLRAPFENEFDVIALFDVLEHIENDDLALENISKMLREEGKVVLTVPSHMWLWNQDDTIAGHKVRYTKQQLIKKLEENGFEILRARYFFMSIVPLFLVRRFINKDIGYVREEDEYKKDISMNPLLNWVLLYVSKIENKLNDFLPNVFGGSLFVIARKK